MEEELVMLTIDSLLTKGLGCQKGWSVPGGLRGPSKRSRSDGTRRKALRRTAGAGTFSSRPQNVVTFRLIF